MRFSAVSPQRRRLLVWSAVGQATTVVGAVAAELLGAATPVRVLAVALAAAAIAATALAVRAILREDRRRATVAQDVVRLSSGLLVVVDRDGTVVTANPSACRAFGRSEAELLGMPIWDVGFTDAEASRRALRALLAGDVAVADHRSERTIVVPDGRTVIVAFSVAPITDDHGTLTHLLVSGEDVTEARRREAQRRRDAHDVVQLRALAQAVAARQDARPAVVDRVRQMLGADLCALLEPDADGTLELTATTSERLRADAVELERIPWAAGAAPDAATLGHVRSAMLALGDCASLRVDPVAGPGPRTAGLLVTGWHGAVDEIDARRGQLLALAADETAIALDRIRSVRRLEALAMTDALTGVPNRRAFDAELRRALARARRGGGGVALIVLDLNEFKALNDREGHDAGDALLSGCTGAWEAQLRAGDLLARLGGDEFAVILPACDFDGVQVLADRLRDATPHPAGAAIGSAVWTGESPDELYRLADRALYRDKRATQASRITDPRRIAAVEATGLWDAGQSPALDRLAAEAGDLIDCPGVYVTLVGRDRLVYAAKPDAETADGRGLERAYCQHAVATGRPFVVDDAREEPLTAASPAVAEGLIAYAGIPVADGDGNVLGALCACDDRPRAWNPSELRVLDRYAARVARQLQTGAAPTAAV